MTDRKFTDEEIVKALEHCKDDDCENCPRWSGEWYSGQCADFLPSLLDIINRQKAEIEELKICNERQKHAIKVYQIDETRREVAREIVLEIDTLVCCHANGDIDDKRLYILFDALKKKYTEEQK